MKNKMLLLRRKLVIFGVVLLFIFGMFYVLGMQNRDQSNIVYDEEYYEERSEDDSSQIYENIAVSNISEDEILEDLKQFDLELSNYIIYARYKAKGNYDKELLYADIETVKYDNENVVGRENIYDIISSMRNDKDYKDIKIIKGELEYFGDNKSIKDVLEEIK